MSIFSDLFSGGTSNLVNSVGNAIDKVITSKEEKMQIELEMKKAEMQYQVDMKKLSIQEQQMIYQDVASARTMASNVQTSSFATRFSKNISPILALSTTALTFVLFYMIFFRSSEIRPENKDIVVYILGVLSAIVTQIFGFYFGSSMGSADKAQTLQNIYEKEIKK